MRWQLDRARCLGCLAALAVAGLMLYALTVYSRDESESAGEQDF